MLKPILDVITVVYNGKKEIEFTIKNVHAQTYSDIRHIIIDGGSTDGTLEIIQKHKDKLFQWISEKDNGIYDAMNKGLAASSGDFICFINAGDGFYANTTVEQVFSFPEADAFYGDVEYIDENENSLGTRTLKKPPKNLTHESFSKGMVVSHQSIIIKREKAEKFNTSYTHVADVDWMIRSLKRCSQITNTNLIISKFLMGGHSKRNIIPSNIERLKVLLKHFSFFRVMKDHLGMSVNFLKYLLTSKKKYY